MKSKQKQKPGYPAHPLAELFPRPSKADRTKLLLDIKQHGQLNKIVLLEEQVLDGLSRQDICLELSIEPGYVQYTDLNVKMTPFDYVVSQNFTRRHLTPGQKAILATKIIKARQTGPSSANSRSDGKASKKVAELVGVSARSVECAVKVMAHGTEQLQQAVERGTISVSAAEQIAELLADEQNAIAKSESKKEAVKAAKDILANKRKNSAVAAGNVPVAIGKLPSLTEPGSAPAVRSTAEPTGSTNTVCAPVVSGVASKDQIADIDVDTVERAIAVLDAGKSLKMAVSAAGERKLSDASKRSVLAEPTVAGCTGSRHASCPMEATDTTKLQRFTGGFGADFVIWAATQTDAVAKIKDRRATLRFYAERDGVEFQRDKYFLNTADGKRIPVSNDEFNDVDI